MKWIPIMDYAMKNNVSVSTLRRYIKANRISFKVEDGRYLLQDYDSTTAISEPNENMALALKRAQEEIAELKTLIAYYEEKLLHTPPPSQFRIERFGVDA